MVNSFWTLPREIGRNYAACGCPSFHDAYEGVCWGRCHYLRRRRNRFWIRVLRMAAAIIGGVGALWLLSGDRDPDAAILDNAPFTASILVTTHTAYDFQGIQFFELNLGGGTRAVISADGDLPLTKWLQAHQRERLSLTLMPAQTLTR